MFDICVIGGGAAGMTAAIIAKENNCQLNICIAEKKQDLGKKLLATGNGKCNISNINCENYLKTLDFFSSIGVITRTDDAGRIYPYTEEARAVVEALSSRIKTLGIKVIRNCTVLNIAKKENFVVKLETLSVSEKKAQPKIQNVEAKKILIATGGKAGPEFGCSGDGYKFARIFGHTINKATPILTAVETVEDFSKFAGIRAKGKVSLIKVIGELIPQSTTEQAAAANVIFAEEGEIQFTKDGLSGICVFNLTRHIEIENGKTLEDGLREYKISVDFLPDIDIKDLLEQRKTLKDFTAKDLLRTFVREPLTLDILRQSQISPNKRASQLEKNQLISLEKVLHNWQVSIKMLKGWKFAQVTKGGVDLGEINLQTMESKLVRGLFFAGEVIDYDGPCGGYNLQNAWETAIKAGKEMSNV